MAVGSGITRRAYHLAMTVLAAAQALVYGLALEVLGLVEGSTGGWGVDLAFFRPPPLSDLSAPARLACYVVVFLLLAHVAICIGVTHRRWGTLGIYALLVGAVAAVTTIVITVTLAGWWGSVGRWLGDQSPAQLVALWPLPLLALLVAAGRAGIRGATP